MPEIDWKEFEHQKIDLPIIDVRSPSEFCKGHILNAHNVPLLNDKERIAVGTQYKKTGKIEAVKIGFRLVGPRLANMIERVEQLSKNRKILAYCWRGGMRSSNFCQFMEMAGIQVSYLKGGYKTYRQNAHAFFKYPFRLILISGYTGSGKSEMLRVLDKKGEQVVDLEHMAHHKGSVFGGLGMSQQPTTEQFQNVLFEKLSTFNLSRPIWVEDESISIGKIFIPNDFWNSMRESPIVVCQLNKKIRIKRLVKEYGLINTELFCQAMEKIIKKLGRQNFKEAKTQLSQNNMYGVIEILLSYYDKAYLYSLEKRNPTIWLTLNWDDKKIDGVVSHIMQCIGHKFKHVLNNESY